MGEKKGLRGVSVGLTTLVVMFAVMCLTIFAVLALSTAKQEERLAEKYAAAEAAYMAADARCASIANGFGALWKEGNESSALQEYAEKTGATVSEDNGDMLVYYECGIDKENVLCVTLRLGSNFLIEQWQQVPVDDWTPDMSIEVWQGE